MAVKGPGEYRHSTISPRNEDITEVKSVRSQVTAADLHEHTSNSERRIRADVSKVEQLFRTELNEERREREASQRLHADKTDAALGDIKKTVGSLQGTLSEINSKLQATDVRTAAQRDWFKWALPITITLILGLSKFLKCTV